MLELKRKDTKELDYGCHSHTSTAIEYINMQINFANGIIPMKSERNWDFIQDIEYTFVYEEEQGVTYLILCQRVALPETVALRTSLSWLSTPCGTKKGPELYLWF